MAPQQKSRPRRAKHRLTILGLAGLIAAVALFYQFGWQFTGFRMVTHPDLLLTETVTQSGDRLIITGRTALNIGAYAGAVMEYREGVLTIGVRFSLFGSDPNYQIEYPQSLGPVDRIVLRRNDIFRTIWIRPWKEQALE